MEIEGTGFEGEGLAVVVKRGSEFEAIVVDLEGRRQPEWAPFVIDEPGNRRPVSLADWGADDNDHAGRVRALLYPLQSEGKLVAAAVFRFI